MIRFIYIFFLYAFITACTAKKSVTTTKQQIDHQFDLLAQKNHHIGFVLKDLEKNQVVYELNADKPFIAASTIKLLNFYTGLHFMADSVPSYQYIIKGDSLIIWPMADPTFLNPDFKDQPAFDFLKNSGKNIYLVSGRYKGEKFGKGWFWDDYNESYQAEITDFPMYKNMVTCSQNTDGTFSMSPDLASLYYSEKSVHKSLKSIKRNAFNNNIFVPEQLNLGYKQLIPISFNSNIKESLLTDTLLATGLITSSVSTLPWRPVSANAKIIYNTQADLVYKKMLQNSDNFLAEQLLLNYAAQQQLNMDASLIIQKAQQELFNDVDKSSYHWVDGSGLSRLNLISPSFGITLLEKLRQQVNNDKLFDLLAAGNKSGTLKNMFKTSSNSFVYAKSGSLSNNYNLVGYLVGKSGKKYAFSYLNNNFIAPVSAVRTDVEQLLTFIHQNY
ncbi:D-alanyl-D-alanine carboxypeptidase [Pedobacter glucosidilyticus]|uniref:D-alanyl-D-alanine carboxypeptidase n=1 Tax=Pedobacter glucosidilyticus TaxID=1122941 RepID=UPI0026EAA98F|nr:D-alanyl-D-alanine carboxypeptidase [Pedobacter glucosidilyticus]